MVKNIFFQKRGRFLIMIIIIVFGVILINYFDIFVITGKTVTETIESANNVGYYSSIAIDSNNKVHISHQDVTNLDLRYCNNIAGSWNCTAIDTANAVGYYSSIAIDSNDKVHISHLDETFDDLRYCNNTGSWSCATIDSINNSGKYSSIAIDSNNKVHISHLEDIDRDLRYCNNIAGSWNCTAIDIPNNVGQFSSIAIDSNNKVHISHYEGGISGDLRYCNDIAGSWNCTTIDTVNVGYYSSIAIDSNNKVHISHYEVGIGLRYCNNIAGSWNCSKLADADGALGNPNGRALAIKKGRIVDSVSFSGVHVSWQNNTNLMHTLVAPSPTYSDNSTNTTLAGVPTLFSLRWNDTSNLSSYIFSWYNGTNWTKINNSGDKESGEQSFSGLLIEVNYTTQTCSGYWGTDCESWTSGCSSESDNTHDSCATCAGGVNDEHVEEVYINGTAFAQNDIVNITCQYDPYSTSTEEYIWVKYPDSSWTKLYDASAPGADPHNISVTFSDTSQTGQYWVRCITNYAGTGATPCESGSYFDHDNTPFNITGVGIEENKTPITYLDVLSELYDEINNITVTINVSYYNTSGSMENGNNNATLWLEVYNGSDWIDEGDFGVSAIGDFSIIVTTFSVLTGWKTESNRDVRISARYMDYNSSTIYDTVNWTDVWIETYSQQEMLDDSSVAFTDSDCPSPKIECWSNITKTVTPTVGATIKWKVSANNTANSWNTSLTYEYITTTQCSPTLDQDWVISDAQVCDGVEVTTGTGWINITSTGNLTLINAANVTTTKLNILGTGDKVFINLGSRIIT